MYVDENQHAIHGVAAEETTTPCNHRWELFDKPTNGGFGTAQAVGWECTICGEVQEL